jgi:hypothetical protein
MQKVIVHIPNGPSLPMLKTANGERLTTRHVVAVALGTTDNALRLIHSRYQHRFDTVSVADRHAIQFLKDHKDAFGVKYVRGDMRLVTLRDAIRFATLSNSPTAVDFQEAILDEIIRSTLENTVSTAEFQATIARLEAQNQQLAERIDQVQPALRVAASSAGRALHAQKELKALLN